MIVANGKALCEQQRYKNKKNGAKYSCDGSNPSGHTDFKLKNIWRDIMKEIITHFSFIDDDETSYDAADRVLKEVQKEYTVNQVISIETFSDGDGYLVLLAEKR